MLDEKLSVLFYFGNYICDCDLQKKQSEEKIRPFNRLSIINDRFIIAIVSEHIYVIE